MSDRTLSSKSRACSNHRRVTRLVTGPERVIDANRRALSAPSAHLAPADREAPSVRRAADCNGRPSVRARTPSSQKAIHR